MHSRASDLWLVVLDESSATGAASASAAAGHRVTQQISPRVFVVEGSDPDELMALPEVVVVTDGDVPEGVRQTLDTSEGLFVDAFVERSRPKNRRGDGQPWDAPEFQPPDPPP